MKQSNYRETLPGGHCFTCHQDFTEMFEEHKCFLQGSNPTPCKAECDDSPHLILFRSQSA